MDNAFNDMTADQVLCRRTILTHISSINNLARQMTAAADMYDKQLMRAIMPHIDKILEANNSILLLSNPK